MRRPKQRVFFLIIISFALCVFFTQSQWGKHRFLMGLESMHNNTDLEYMASFSWLRWDGDESENKQVITYVEHRKANVRSVCERNNLTKSSFVLDRNVAAQLYVEHSHKFIYCEVPKVGCSNWKRIILQLNESLGLNVDELKHDQLHTSKLLIKLSNYPPSLQKELLANYTKVMITRDPIERVVSAYRDKFLHSDDSEYYTKVFPKMIRKLVAIDSKANITFEHFARFITKENPFYRDTHWKPMYQLCDPCNIQYDFIGKFETLEQDADYVLRTIGAPPNMKYPAIKQHSNESRTNEDITISYLEMLSPILFRKLMKVYNLDFPMFEYSYYNYTISKFP
ncbi:carbohydrate sulfotransferase 9-like [Dendropsophus ebraccatus]|uniref:carbohydrate sulfotransferase 9-like n=1 Tax=Dendropsophus ebraccatus TaxID=150705 RepID=UPI003831439A